MSRSARSGRGNYVAGPRRRSDPPGSRGADDWSAYRQPQGGLIPCSKKVVWATDGSEAADLALPYAKALATDGGGELVVIHCEELAKGSGARRQDDLKAKIKRQAAELGEDGVKVSLRTVTTGVGGAAHVIADVARDQHADVIVVGTRGCTALAGPLLGSVTQRLLHIAPPWPVLAVPAANHNPSG